MNTLTQKLKPSQCVNSDEYAVGQWLYSSWGYEQTNIDFYLIVKRTESMVFLQQYETIRCQHSEPGYSDMSGVAVPDKSKPVGGVIKRKLGVYGDKISGCSIESFAGAYPWDGSKKYCSWYA